MSAVTVDEIIGAVADEFRLSRWSLQSRDSRTAVGARKGSGRDRLADALAVAAYLALRHTRTPKRAIGDALGGRHANQIQMSTDRLAERIAHEPELAAAVERIEAAIDELHERRIGAQGAVSGEQGREI